MGRRSKLRALSNLFPSDPCAAGTCRDPPGPEPDDSHSDEPVDSYSDSYSDGLVTEE